MRALKTVLQPALAAMIALAGLASPSAAQEKGIGLELNNARDDGGNCRLTYMALNGTPAAVEKLTYYVYLFDADRKVSKSLLLEFGRLTAGKTKVVEFNLPGSCKGISRILVNDASECVVGGKESPVCLEALKTSTLTDIAFGM